MGKVLWKPGDNAEGYSCLCQDSYPDTTIAIWGCPLHAIATYFRALAGLDQGRGCVESARGQHLHDPDRSRDLWQAW